MGISEARICISCCSPQFRGPTALPGSRFVFDKAEIFKTLKVLTHRHPRYAQSRSQRLRRDGGRLFHQLEHGGPAAVPGRFSHVYFLKQTLA
jgi:hypothetical protein